MRTADEDERRAVRIGEHLEAEAAFETTKRELREEAAGGPGRARRTERTRLSVDADGALNDDPADG